MLLTGAAFGRLFDDVEHTAFRLETRDRYDDPGEKVALARFLSGEPIDPAWHEPWLHMIRSWVADGRRMSRVRIVSLPLSGYCRFAMACSAAANNTGEDIRYLRRDDAAGLPAQDYWLFDSRTLARMHFTDADVLLGVEVVTDPVAVVQANAWRDMAQHRALPQERFSTR